MIQATKDHLINAIDFSALGRPTASYVVERKTIRMPFLAPTYKVDGVTVLRCTLADHGWMDPNIMWVFTKLDASAPLLLVEVGSWKGQSSVAFAKHLKQLGPDHRLVCVDTWLGAPEFWTWGLRDRSRGQHLDTSDIALCVCVHERKKCVRKRGRDDLYVREGRRI